ncbi:MAG: hypothetical protein N3D77_16045, partial [Geminicoccaceae bacterium]|nr:hypothetical protein [Geminicoccaceae bacterium]
AHVLRVYRGALVVPARDAGGALHGLKFIDASGAKRFLAGARVQGLYCLIGSPGDEGRGEQAGRAGEQRAAEHGAVSRWFVGAPL